MAIESCLSGALRQHQLEQSNYCLMLLRPLLVLLFLTSLLLYSLEFSFACLMSNLSKSASPGQSKLCHFEYGARRAFARRAVHSNDYSGPLATVLMPLSRAPIRVLEPTHSPVHRAEMAKTDRLPDDLKSGAHCRR